MAKKATAGKIIFRRASDLQQNKVDKFFDYKGGKDNKYKSKGKRILGGDLDSENSANIDESDLEMAQFLNKKKNYY